MAGNKPTIRLIKYQDPAMGAPIYYWVLINKPTERIGPIYFLSQQEAWDWATQNGYKYK
jgi:hypothetical protein